MVRNRMHSLSVCFTQNWGVSLKKMTQPHYLWLGWGATDFIGRLHLHGFWSSGWNPTPVWNSSHSVRTR